MLIIIFHPTTGRDEPRVVIEESDVTIPIERQVNGKTVLAETGYRAIRTRAATAAEVDRWRYDKESTC